MDLSYNNVKLIEFINNINNKNKINNIDLSNCQLNRLPNELFSISNEITLLNLGNNDLESLPNEFIQFNELKILFFAQNKFTTIPLVISSLPSLFMLSFKSNKIINIPNEALNSNLGWLILTDNQLAELPNDIGSICPNIRKLMLASNKLNNIPESLSNCKDLELLRIAANNITTIPYWLFTLPKLSWLAMAGNPITINNNINNDIRLIPWSDISLGQVLGEGASGIVYKGTLLENGIEINVAIKIYKGEATSDGLPEDEMKAAEAVGDHFNSIRVLGRLINIPNDKQGLILSLIPPSYITLGGPPSFDTVTRDVYSPDLKLQLVIVLEILCGVSSLASHLHSKHISHGDLYAHNILVDFNTGHTLLGDFGAATNYHNLIQINNNPHIDIGRGIQGIEVRAFGCLADELFNRIYEHDNITTDQIENNRIISNDLKTLIGNCMNTNPFVRPLFEDINRKLVSLKELLLQS